MNSEEYSIHMISDVFQIGGGFRKVQSNLPFGMRRDSYLESLPYSSHTDL